MSKTQNTQPGLGAAWEYTVAQLGGPIVESQNNPTVSSGLTIVAQGKGDRVGLIFINVGGVDCWISIDNSASLGAGIYLPAAGGSATFNVRDDFTLPTRQWNASCQLLGATTLTVIEYSRFAINQ